MPSKREKILFFGDSITEQGNEPGGYISIINTFIQENGLDSTYLTIGKGISGNKVTDLWNRVQRDVLTHQPSVVFIYIGINDVWHFKFDGGTEAAQFRTILKDLVMKIKASNAKVILCTPSVIGERKNKVNDLDAMLDQYSGIIRDIAHETLSELCDLRKAFTERLQSDNPEDADAGIFTYDTVHLNERGNRLVADTMLPFIRS